MSFVNLFHRADLDLARKVAALEKNAVVLFDTESLFVNTTGDNYTLLAHWKSNWLNASISFEPFISNMTALGFFLGDELVNGGLPLSDIGRMADTVKNTFPNAIVYYNEAYDPFIGKGCPVSYSKVPDSIDWFSVDIYPDYFSIGGAKVRISHL